MKFSKPCRVLISSYQECLRYTVTAKLAPAWNRVGDWFIQGRDFLAHEGYSNAIKMELFVNKDEVFVSLFGTAIRFPPLTIKDLDLSQAEIQALVKSTEEDVHEIMISDRWCHVLPSMKKGKISALSITIPPSSPFTSYLDLKRYWKNMYGYRLPDSDDEILYFCGVALRFQPKIFYASPSLQCAGESSEHVNLSRRPQAIVPVVRPNNILYFPKTESQNSSNTTSEKLTRADNTQSQAECNASNVEKMMKPIPFFNVTPQADTQPLPSTDKCLLTQTSAGKLFPLFRPKKKSDSVDKTQTKQILTHQTFCYKRPTETVSNKASSLTQSALPLFLKTKKNFGKQSCVNTQCETVKFNLGDKSTQSLSLANPCQINNIPISSGEMKRKKTTEAESIKKQRKKSEIQNLDVESLARANKLNKVNTVTLSAWLKEKGILCKAKDKKNDLIEKANQFLNIISNEQKKDRFLFFNVYHSN
ncbi:hypothetical protein Btru_011824 [Bulinus truncatus]|nr:hypothetical protein Btru_011824 [Bulinus truncatus]